MSIKILRLGHRQFRDARITTHVGLVARAFGADEIILSGEEDSKIIESLDDVTERWGGHFSVSYEKNWRKVIKGFKGVKVHLTVYGLPIEDNIEKIRKTKKDLMVIVGGEKVPGEVYDMVDYNLSVTLQPHSEVASLCLFLDYYFKRKELEKKFKKAKIKIVPQERGKTLVED